MNKIFCAALLLVNQAAFSYAPCSPLESKTSGAILGAAIGDALGRITEFMSFKESIIQAYGKDGLTSFAQFDHYDFVDGVAAYTDDTVMAKILLERCLECHDKKLSDDAMLDALAKDYMNLFGPKKYEIDPYYAIRAHGPTSFYASKTLRERLKEKTNGAVFAKQWWNRLPEDFSTTFYADIQKEGGCGSVMRAWPLGIVFYSDVQRIKQLADQQSIITHRHPLARASSVAIAVGVAYAMQGASVEAIVEQMINAAKNFDAQELLYKPSAIKLADTVCFDKTLIANNALLTSDMIRYAYEMARQGYEPDLILGTHNKKQENFRSPEGFLLGWAGDEAVAAAVYIFVRHCQQLHNAIVEGVNTPGDSDSIATLAGALVGAYSGINSLHEAGFDYSALENKDALIALAQHAAL